MRSGMRKCVLCVMLPVLTLAGGTSIAANQAAPKAAANCQLRDHADYTAKIKQYTTAPTFSTELVDHLPWSSCVPAPDAALGHIIGAPDVLDHVKEINAYMRLLESKSPRVKVFSIGTTEENHEIIMVAISDEANMRRLDEFKRGMARLADPRSTPQAEADKLIATTVSF